MVKTQILSSGSSKAVIQNGKVVGKTETQTINFTVAGDGAVGEAVTLFGSYTVGSDSTWYSVGGFTLPFTSTPKVISADMNAENRAVVKIQIVLEGTARSTTAPDFIETITKQYAIEKFNIIEVPNSGPVVMSKGFQTKNISLSGQYILPQGDSGYLAASLWTLGDDRITAFKAAYVTGEGLLQDAQVIVSDYNCSYSATAILKA